MRVPPAKRRQQWLEFWNRYREEKKVLEAYYGGELSADVELELLSMKLVVEFRLPTAEQLSVRKWKAQKRRSDAAKRD